jgi:hypothetical protein
MVELFLISRIVIGLRDDSSHLRADDGQTGTCSLTTQSPQFIKRLAPGVSFIPAADRVKCRNLPRGACPQSIPVRMHDKPLRSCADKMKWIAGHERNGKFR